MFAGYALLMFFATVLVVGYYIFLFVIKCAKKLYHKLFPEKVVLPPPPVFTLYHYYDDFIGTFDTAREAFEKGCSLILEKIEDDFSKHRETSLTEIHGEYNTAPCTYHIVKSVGDKRYCASYFNIYYDRITCGNLEKMRPKELVAKLR